MESTLYKDVTAVFKPAQDRAVAIRVAIMQAFAQVGDQQALPLVMRLAEADAKTEGERRIQEAARMCLTSIGFRRFLAIALPRSAARNHNP